MTSTVGDNLSFRWSSAHPSSVEVFWEIGPMSNIFKEKTDKYSPVFQFRKQNWKLSLSLFDYYGSINILDGPVYVDVMREKPSNDAEVGHCYLGLKRSDGVEQTIGIKKFITKYQGSGWLSVQDGGWLSEECFAITPSLLKKYREAIMPRDHLALTCRISMMKAGVTVMEAFTQTEEPECDEDIGKDGCQPADSEKVLEAIKKLWDSGENSDVIIHVGDVEFKAHRAILGARTPVLLAMFQHDTIEKTTGVVTISDCEPAIFEEFLHYIYTGALKELSAKNAPALYAVANKYFVAELKAQCLHCIRSNLCIDTFCNSVLLALNYGEEELFELAIEFATKNIRKIIRSVEWQRFADEHSAKANEILIKALGPE